MHPFLILTTLTTLLTTALSLCHCGSFMPPSGSSLNLTTLYHDNACHPLSINLNPQDVQPQLDIIEAQCYLAFFVSDDCSGTETGLSTSVTDLGAIDVGGLGMSRIGSYRASLEGEAMRKHARDVHSCP